MPALIDTEDRAGSIADKQRPVLIEREAARDAEIGGKRLDRPVRLQAVHGAFETAGHVEVPFWSERHRGRIHYPGRKGFACSVGPDAKYRHRDLLTACSAVGDVE